MRSESKISSYAALEGFGVDESNVGHSDIGTDVPVNPLLVQKIELQTQIQMEVKRIMEHNVRLFIRPCKLCQEEKGKY